MTKLNQIIAVANGKKTKCKNDLTKLYHAIQQTGLFSGISKSYRPKDEDGDKLPPESKKVQLTVGAVLNEAAQSLGDMFDVIATQEWANCQAKSSVVVDGETVLDDVPVTYLLFLEKQLVDFATTVSALPTLDPAYEWSYNESQGCYSTPAVETTRTKKVPRNHVKAEATKEHPAQVDVYHEDIVAGYWSTVSYSGAISVTDKKQLLARVSSLIDAIKAAREQANSISAPNVEVGKKLFGYLLK